MIKELRELREGYAPFAEELDDILSRKEIGITTIFQCRAIINRAYMDALEKAFDAGMAFEINKNKES